MDPNVETGDGAERSVPLHGFFWTAGDGVRPLETPAAVRQAHLTPGSRLWIDLEDPPHELLTELAECLGVHPLVIEDIAERNQRAKIELTGEFLHLVMFHMSYAGEIVSQEVDIVVGEGFLLTAHDKGVPIRTAPFLRRDISTYLSGGTDYLLWAISDWLVDGYFPVFDQLGDEIDELGDDVMRRPSSWLVERLFGMRRQLLVIRHAVVPQREIYNQLTNRDLPLIDPDRIIYFRDVYDHLIRLTDELDSYREMVGTTLDIYLSQVNNNLSEIMKRLTAVTVVVAGAGALAGIFGMSEAATALSSGNVGFWVVTAAILLLTVVGLFYFRRIGWI